MTLLKSVASDSVVAISESLYEFVGTLGKETFGEIGIALGSIMMMFLVVSYAMNILKGGKFELNMLIPIIIYSCICNFSVISEPVLDFTHTITKQLVEACVSKKESLYSEAGIVSFSGSLFDVFYEKYKNEVSDEPPVDEEPKENGETEMSTYEAIKKAFNDVLEAKKELLSYEFSTRYDDSGEKPGIFKRMFIALFAKMMGFFTEVASLIYQSWGIVMTCIVVIFGPISFAFALLPGRLNTIMNWFLRIVQFSLYAPICCLLDVLFLKVLLVQVNFLSVLGFLGICAANLLSIMSVPTIASFVVEGPQGGDSLSGAVRTAMAIGSFIKGKIGGDKSASSGAANAAAKAGEAAAGLPPVGIPGSGGSK